MQHVKPHADEITSFFEDLFQEYAVPKVESVVKEKMGFGVLYNGEYMGELPEVTVRPSI